MNKEAKNPGGGAPNASPDQKREQQKLMGILSYIGPLVIISYATAKDDPFVKFHIKQGLVLLAIEVVVWFASAMIWTLWPLLQIVNLGTLILSILGIMNVANNKQEELPLVGKYSSHFSI